jgi:hypothetical protein
MHFVVHFKVGHLGFRKRRRGHVKNYCRKKCMLGEKIHFAYSLSFHPKMHPHFALSVGDPSVAI